MNIVILKLVYQQIEIQLFIDNCANVLAMLIFNYNL